MLREHITLRGLMRVTQGPGLEETTRQGHVCMLMWMLKTETFCECVLLVYESFTERVSCDTWCHSLFL